MLNHEIKIHDRKQFEVKLHYPFNKKRSEREYLVETYFFIPSTLGINKFSFHKKNFYDSVKNYIRFATPQLSLKKLGYFVDSAIMVIREVENDKPKKDKFKYFKIFFESIVAYHKVYAK